MIQENLHSGEDSEEDNDEDNEEEDEEVGEGFVLDRNVADAVLPDLTEAFSSLLGKVRAVVKFFRDIFSEFYKILLLFLPFSTIIEPGLNSVSVVDPKLCFFFGSGSDFSNNFGSGSILGSDY